MKIVMLGAFDCAGVMMGWKRLLDGEMDYFVERKVKVRKDASTKSSKLKSKLEQADVIFHHRVIWFGHDDSKPIEDDRILDIDMEEYRDKTIIFLNGSKNLRVLSDWYRNKFEGRKIVATTPDLCVLFGAEYLPQPIVLDRPLESKPSMPPVRCCHCPTDKSIKNTEEWEEVVEHIVGKFGPESFVGKTIGGYTNEQCVDEKFSKWHMGFDHLQGYFGVNTIESAWAGCACLASLKPEYSCVFQKFADTWTLPFVNVLDANELRIRLDLFVSDPEFVEAEGLRARRWMEQFWSKERHIGNLERMVRACNPVTACYI